MAINGEAIHGTRPWKVFGEGPNITKPAPGQKYSESNRKDFTEADVRFTTKAGVLYTFFMGWPADRRELNLVPLGKGRPYVAGQIASVELLGHSGELKWAHDDAALRITLPEVKSGAHAFALKIRGLET